MSLSSYVAVIFYDSLGHTGETYYARFVDKHTGKIYDVTNEELSELPSWSDSVVSMTEDGTTGAFPIMTPDELPVGHIYDVNVHKQAGGSPAESDDVEQTYELKHGSVMGF